MKAARETLTVAGDYMTRCKALIDDLDRQPAFIRNADSAKQARALAVDSMGLCWELLTRLRWEIQQEQQGVEHVVSE